MCVIFFLVQSWHVFAIIKHSSRLSLSLMIQLDGFENDTSTLKRIDKTHYTSLSLISRTGVNLALTEVRFITSVRYELILLMSTIRVI